MLKIVHGLSPLSPDLNNELSQNLRRQVCYLMYVVDHTKHEHCDYYFCQL